MQHILMAAGWTEYQASCLSPILWAIAALAVVYLVVGGIEDSKCFRRIRARHKAEAYNKAIRRAKRKANQAAGREQQNSRDERQGGAA